MEALSSAPRIVGDEVLTTGQVGGDVILRGSAIAKEVKPDISMAFAMMNG